MGYGISTDEFLQHARQRAESMEKKYVFICPACHHEYLIIVKGRAKVYVGLVLTCPKCKAESTITEIIENSPNS